MLAETQITKPTDCRTTQALATVPATTIKRADVDMAERVAEATSLRRDDWTIRFHSHRAVEEIMGTRNRNTAMHMDLSSHLTEMKIRSAMHTANDSRPPTEVTIHTSRTRLTYVPRSIPRPQLLSMITLRMSVLASISNGKCQKPRLKSFRPQNCPLSPVRIAMTLLEANDRDLAAVPLRRNCYRRLPFRKKHGKTALKPTTTRDMIMEGMITTIRFEILRQ